MVHHLAIHIVKAGEYVLQHHEVGEQNVRRVVGYGIALRVAFLPGVAGDGEGPLIGGIAVQEFVQLFQLAVGQGVHRVDDDGSGALFTAFCLGLDDSVDDRNEE